MNPREKSKVASAITQAMSVGWQPIADTATADGEPEPTPPQHPHETNQQYALRFDVTMPHQSTYSLEDRVRLCAMLSSQYWPAGKKTRRAVTDFEVNDLLTAIEQNPDALRVRVYSRAGFVPNSYIWRCEIQCVEATRSDGAVWWTVKLHGGSALRHGGSGPHVLIR